MIRKPKYFAIITVFVCVFLLPYIVTAQQECPEFPNLGKYIYGDFYGVGGNPLAGIGGGIICVGNERWASNITWGNSNYSYAGDFNGDGKVDLASAHNGNVYMFINKGDRFESQVWKVSGRWGKYKDTWIGDFNGDGKTDIASANTGDIFMYISKGDRFESQVWKVPVKWAESSNTKVVDINGDGKSDIISLARDEVYLNFSEGNGFISQTWAIKPCDRSSSYVEAWRGQHLGIWDFNKDGKLDFYGYDRNVPPDEAKASGIKGVRIVSGGSTVLIEGLHFYIYQKNGSFCISKRVPQV